MLIGNLITLRRIDWEDLDKLMLLESETIVRSDFFQFDSYSEVEYRKLFHKTSFWNEKHGTLLIIDSNDEIIGCIGYNDRCVIYDGYQLFYIIYKQNNRGKGYISEALQLFVCHLFETRRINRLQLYTHTENIASQRVAEKCGFSFEGIARGASYHKGIYNDITIYSILRADLYSN